MIMYFSPEQLEDMRKSYGVGCFKCHQMKDDDGSKYWQKKWTAYGNAPVPGEELLCSAARLRYSAQFLDRRRETKAFSSALRDASFGYKAAPLVKKVLTLVRPATRSGCAYGKGEKVDHRTKTLQNPLSFEGYAFWGYEPPSFPPVDAPPQRTTRYSFWKAPYLEREERFPFQAVDVWQGKLWSLAEEEEEDKEEDGEVEDMDWDPLEEEEKEAPKEGRNVLKIRPYVLDGPKEGRNVGPPAKKEEKTRFSGVRAFFRWG